MRYSLLAALVAAQTTCASVLPLQVQHGSQRPLMAPATAAEQFLIELTPGKTQWVTEEQKWELKRQGVRFMDITAYPELHAKSAYKASAQPALPVAFPVRPAHEKHLKPVLAQLDKDKMRSHLEYFSSFHTRFFKSDYGRKSSAWLLGQVENTVFDNLTKADSAHKSTHSTPKTKTLNAEHKYTEGLSVKPFEHIWGQSSVIATLPGKSNRTVVIGAHQDSVNMYLPWVFAAPGADDDGSGTVTILEALRVLLLAPASHGNGTLGEALARGDTEGLLENTIEFHWYSAEEGGLLGSQAIFNEYQQQGRDVKAMLQQDMTGYIQGTLDAHQPESVGVITDFVDAGLTTFIKTIIEHYCDIPYVLTKCGYACSDHASAGKAGYPSAFVIESAFDKSDQHIHTTEDTIDRLSFDHMRQHAKLTLAFAYELGRASFEHV